MSLRNHAPVDHRRVAAALGQSDLTMPDLAARLWEEHGVSAAPATLLGKNTLHLIGMDARGRIVLRRKISRGQLQQCLVNLPVCLIGLEACAGAHHVGRQLAALGHDVRLLPAQYVKPFLKGHKNDYRDAEAIAEAAQRPTVLFR